MADFDPNGAALEDSGIFGLPYSLGEAKLVFVPVPWDATASYGEGASGAPAAIEEASKYTELYDVDLGRIYEYPMAMDDVSLDELQKQNAEARALAAPIIEQGGAIDEKLKEAAQKVDVLSKEMESFVASRVMLWLTDKRTVGVVGGDHSISLGSIKAHLDAYPAMGVLQIDAHCDLRKQFEGFTFSHGSVMHNVLEETALTSLVQVGVRGLCEEEYECTQSDKRVTTFYDRDIAESLAAGDTWNAVVDRIIEALPKQVYISFDIDGLNPSLCPNTGTPVPGGLSMRDCILLLKRIVASGRQIIGFDLVEVGVSSKSAWDADVGAQVLYQLAGWTLASNDPERIAERVTAKHVQDQQTTASSSPVTKEG